MNEVNDAQPTTAASATDDPKSGKSLLSFSLLYSKLTLSPNLTTDIGGRLCFILLPPFF